MFVQLHCHHAGGSMLDSVVSSEELAKRASEFHHPALAVTDHGRLSAWFEHHLACSKYGIKPIYGIEQYVIPDDELVTLNDKGKRVRSKNNHLILLAKNNEGMNNIRRLHYISMKEENHFYYNNHSTFSEIFKYSEGVICGTACMMSPFANALKEGNPEKAENLFNLFLNNFKDNFYVEVQLNELTNEMAALPFGQKSVNNFMIDLANKNGVPIVITGDVHYLDKEDYRIQDISLAMREKRTANDPGFSLESKTLFYHDVSDYKFFNERFGYGYSEAQIDEWCNNTSEIAAHCDAEIPERTTMIFPNVTINDEYEMEKIAKEKLAEMFNVEDWKQAPPEYIERLERELDLLKRKGFGSYCMVLRDIFQFCEDTHTPTGFGRGCFLPDNIVTLENCKKKISEVQEGDKIISGFGKKTYVEKKFEYDIEEPITKIKISGKEISCTQDHKILVVRQGLEPRIENAMFVEASTIRPGDFLIKIKIKMDFIRVDDIDNSQNYKGKVYDLRVHGIDHSYKIEDFTVHNSGCGSLVLYLLGITKIDPIPYNLLFERFVSKERCVDCVVDYFN